MRAEAWRSSLHLGGAAKSNCALSNQIKLRLKLGLELRPAVCVVTERMLIGRRGREVGHFRMLSRAAARRDPGTGQRVGWRGASGYMYGALGLLSHWFDSGDVRCARAAARARATRF